MAAHENLGPQFHGRPSINATAAEGMPLMLAMHDAHWSSGSPNIDMRRSWTSLGRRAAGLISQRAWDPGDA